MANLKQNYQKLWKFWTVDLLLFYAPKENHFGCYTYGNIPDFQNKVYQWGLEISYQH